MGRDGGEQILPALMDEAKKASTGSGATFAIIAGDFAYDMHDLSGKRGATFMNRLQNISAFLPTLGVCGNHEQATGNTTHFTNILGKAFPGTALGHWYSVNTGLIHWVFLNSEVYHMPPFTLHDDSGQPFVVSAPTQLEWLEKDLAGVDRVATPWVVAVYHRPMYCSNSDNDECSNSPLNWPSNPLRVDLEPLFVKAGVDLCVEAHEHSVEYVWPIVNGTVQARDYINPKAPVHYITGAAGCNEDLGICFNPILQPSFFTDKYLWGPKQYSYTRLHHNATVLRLEQVTVFPSPSIWATMEIVKN